MIYDISIRHQDSELTEVIFIIRILSSALKKKHNAICYHYAREAQAAGYIRLCKILGNTAPESTLKKKHNAICYHHAREAQAAGYMRLFKILGNGR